MPSGRDVSDLPFATSSYAPVMPERHAADQPASRQAVLPVDHSGDSSATFITGLSNLSGALNEQRGGFDVAGRLPDSLVAELGAIGVFRLWLPAGLGGPQLSPLEFMEVVEAAAALEGAIGWLVGNGGGMSRAGGFLPVESAQAMFADPRAFVVAATGAVGRAVRVPDGFVVSGRWPFGSGAPHATWFTALCLVEVDGEPSDEMIFVYAPRVDVVLHDNWQVSGLCATGSVDFEFREVFVGERFTHRFQPEPTQPGVIYRLPPGQVFSWTVATVPLGIARGAVDEFVRMAGSGRRRGDSLPLGERELVHAQLGQIDARLGASRAYLRHTMSDLVEAVETGSDLEPMQVAFQMACTFASQSALWAIGLLTEMAGAVSISRACRLERYERDARAAAKHVAMSPNAYTNGGRHHLTRAASNNSH